MKGIILAGGRGTRLLPLTRITNKHLLPVGKEPMIFNPIKQMVASEILDILVVSSREDIGDIEEAVGSGMKFGCNFTFKVQKEPKGIADALLLGEDFASGELITVILGDNIIIKSIKSYVDKFKGQKKGAKVLLKQVSEPHNFGIADFENDRLIEIHEKPIFPKSDYAVIGVYMYDSSVFNIIRNTPMSSRGEFEITSVNNAYINKGEMSYEVLDGDWIDAGTIESYKFANDMLHRINNKIIQGD